MRKLIGLLMLVCAGSVNAATVVMSGGQLMGATGVEVNGASYDVAFLDGSCNSLYNDCTGLAFTTASEMEAASQALIDQVITPQGIYYGNSDLINGINGFNYTIHTSLYVAALVTRSPELELSSSVVLIETPSSYLDGAGVITIDGFGMWYLEFAEAESVSAVWSCSSTSPAACPAVSPVPLPAAAWLFISAIAGLVGAKRLSRSKGSA